MSPVTYGAIFGGLIAAAICVVIFVLIPMWRDSSAPKIVVKPGSPVIDLATARLERKHREATKRQAIEVVDREGA